MTRPLAAATAATLLAATAFTTWRRRNIVITVRGGSMAPTYQDGERLLVRRSRSTRVGDVVVFRMPGPRRRDDPPWLVKRCVAIAGDPVPEPLRDAVPDERVPPAALLVLGDNPQSLDSRRLGYVAASDVLGTARRRMG